MSKYLRAEPPALWANASPGRFDLTDRLVLALSLLIPAVFLAVVSLQPFVDPRWMFFDALTAAEISGDCCHSYYGFVSTSGILLWAGTAAVSLFSAFALMMRDGVGREARFALCAALLTGWLVLDDSFLLHETVLPSFGVPQNFVLFTYATLGVVYVLASWRTVREHNWPLLASSALFFIISMAVDVALHSTESWAVVLEDSAKFMGIFLWMAFHFTAHLHQMGRAVGNSAGGLS